MRGDEFSYVTYLLSGYDGQYVDLREVNNERPIFGLLQPHSVKVVVDYFEF